MAVVPEEMGKRPVGSSTSRQERSPQLLELAAEGVGFEPTRACTLPVFKTGAFNRSATPP
jgi:hypothetical protein